MKTFSELDEKAKRAVLLLHDAAKNKNERDALRSALQALVNYNNQDPDLYDGDDDHVLGRLMKQAEDILEQTKEQKGNK